VIRAATPWGGSVQSSFWLAAGILMLIGRQF
jgi:hypothetical protein